MYILKNEPFASIVQRLGTPASTTLLHSPFLICSTLDSLSEENCHFLCLGAVSGTKLSEVVGLSPFGKNFARVIFRAARWFFKLNAKAIYLNKYHTHIQTTFLLFRDKLSVPELLAIKHFLNVKL